MTNLIAWDPETQKIVNRGAEIWEKNTRIPWERARDSMGIVIVLPDSYPNDWTDCPQTGVIAQRYGGKKEYPLVATVSTSSPDGIVFRAKDNKVYRRLWFI